MDRAASVRLVFAEYVLASVMAVSSTPMDNPFSRHKHRAPAPALIEAVRSRCHRASAVIQLVSSAPATRQASTRSSVSHWAAREIPCRNDDGSPTSEDTSVTFSKSAAVWLEGAA